MPAQRIINKFGKLTGWNAITVNILGRDLEGITELEYNDEQEIENAYGAGGYPVGETDGNYSATCSLTLFLEENKALLQSLPPGTRIQDIAPFDINVVYEVEGVIYKDIIRNCRFRNNGRSASQNDKTMTYQYDLKCSHIDWNQ